MDRYHQLPPVRGTIVVPFITARMFTIAHLARVDFLLWNGRNLFLFKANKARPRHY